MDYLITYLLNSAILQELYQQGLYFMLIHFF